MGIIKDCWVKMIIIVVGGVLVVVVGMLWEEFCNVVEMFWNFFVGVL